MIRIATLSSKNQITIPVDFLMALGASLQKKFLLESQNETIIMRPLKTSVVEQLAGSLTKYVSPDKLGVPFKTIMEETKKKTARYLAHK